MQIKLARTVLEHWDRILKVNLHLDVINLCIKFRGVGEILAVDKTGAFFVANFTKNISKTDTDNDNNHEDNSLDLNNLTLQWTRSDPIKVQKTKRIPVNSTLCLTPNGSTLFKIGGGYPIVSDTWMYDFTQRGLNDEWNTKIPQMNHPRAKCAAVSLNNHSVIAIGGNASGKNRYHSVEMYDVKTGLLIYNNKYQNKYIYTISYKYYQKHGQNYHQQYILDLEVLQ